MRPSKDTSKTRESEIINVLRFRQEPTKEQEKKLLHTLYSCRKLYNQALEERVTSSRNHGIAMRYIDQQNHLPAWKKEHPEYKEVHSQVLQRLDQPFVNFFEKRTRFPKYKNKFRFRSMTYPKARMGYLQKDSYVLLPKIGSVRMAVHQPFDPASIKMINVKFHGGKWYMNLTRVTNESIPTLTTPQNPVGIDLGVLSLVATSDGESFENPKWLQKNEKRLKRAQRQLSRKRKGSKDREKVARKLQRIHDHVANQRKDYLHQISRSLVDRYHLICMEDLSANGMMKNHRLVKSIPNASLGRLGIYLEDKAKNAGKQLIKVPSHHTSQLCSGCAMMVKKDLSVRIHQCPVCRLEIDRDVNAAINILRRGLDILRYVS